jgi:hypothetical protein
MHLPTSLQKISRVGYTCLQQSYAEATFDQNLCSDADEQRHESKYEFLKNEPHFTPEKKGANGEY